MGLDARKPVFGGLRTTKAQNNLRIHSLISAFVIHFLNNFICKLATGEIPIFYIVSVAEETRLNLALRESPEDMFSRDEAQIIFYFLVHKTFVLAYAQGTYSHNMAYLFIKL